MQHWVLENLTMSNKMQLYGHQTGPLGPSTTFSICHVVWHTQQSLSCCSVAKLCPRMVVNQASCPSLSPGVCSGSCPLSRWCYLTISSSATSFSFCLQSFPASGSFPMSWLFAVGGQSIEVSASASVLPVNIQGWFPLGWTSWISLQSKGLSRVFSSATIRKHQFFDAQSSLWSNSHIHIWPLENL